MSATRTPASCQSPALTSASSTKVGVRKSVYSTALMGKSATLAAAMTNTSASTQPGSCTQAAIPAAMIPPSDVPSARSTVRCTVAPVYGCSTMSTVSVTQ